MTKGTGMESKRASVRRAAMPTFGGGAGFEEEELMQG